MPPQLTGDPRLIRIGAGLVVDEVNGCLEHLAAKARPRVRARQRLRHGIDDVFALDPVMGALDRIEHDGIAVASVLADIGTDVSIPEALRTWTAHAVEQYAGATPLGEQRRPMRGWWVIQRGEGTVWELYAWGRCYRSSDGRQRELRLLRFGIAGGRDREPAQVAIAAYATAMGGEGVKPEPWSQQFRVVARPAADYVRVVEIGLLDGSEAILFAGSVSEAETLYREHGEPEVSRVVGGGHTRSGGSCFKCKLFTGCSDVVRAPGLLGLPSHPRVALRKVSVSDLRYYQLCPAQFRLRSWNLPRADEYSVAARIGQAVHGYLEDLHRRQERPCRFEDVPAAGEVWADQRWHLDQAAQDLGAQMLAHHHQVCPLDAQPEQVRVEPTLAVHDTAAQALIIAKPDLLYREGGSWIWREIKTTRQQAAVRDPLDAYPQLALATIMLAEGVLGGDLDGSRVELEILRPSGADLAIIDPCDPSRVAKARQVMRDLAQPWREDEGFAPAPGKNCRTCPVSRWCSAAVADDES
jgi:CRISPR/Cas system-associated exonuclease Cas4 (RecB family)